MWPPRPYPSVPNDGFGIGVQGGDGRVRGMAKAQRYLEATQRISADDFKPSAMPITRLQSMKGPNPTFGEYQLTCNTLYALICVARRGHCRVTIPCRCDSLPL